MTQAQLETIRKDATNRLNEAESVLIDDMRTEKKYRDWVREARISAIDVLDLLKYVEDLSIQKTGSTKTVVCT